MNNKSELTYNFCRLYINIIQPFYSYNNPLQNTQLKLAFHGYHLYKRLQICTTLKQRQQFNYFHRLLSQLSDYTNVLTNIRVYFPLSSLEVFAENGTAGATLTWFSGPVQV